ncbi:orotidine-5'-phosphate decarboxylase [Calorimonas adulescens]|jgi:orotidine 5'-phosphate decarboxylase, subfamily 2|uniref:Orotidine 5'-phosphate decarboxylase n=1 Tax=Calorimonas adulescens TaxID=2606906 RepID=A0A5D8QFJ7_9THEO|nr:orotidine-5'-phosphate decarboxylase [Calorimonas adulescens]TZE82979.1 orotidine-5'-phosphate decarboxylase [Calorimonas adulescens]
MIMQKLQESIGKLNNPFVVGLDTKIDYLPHGVSSVVEFNSGIIDSIYDVVAAVKIQIAMYEERGVEGIEEFYRTAEYAKGRGLMVIADVKRADIGDTAVSYSKAYLSRDCIDFITLNPYLGYDSLAPFFEDSERYDKGVFILVKTSNKSSGDIQNLIVEGRPLYEVVADKVAGWGAVHMDGGYSRIGGVAGATYPDELKRIRGIMRYNYLLIPGYGAQGGTAEDIARALDGDINGILINSSRKVLLAYRKSNKDYREAARNKVLRMKEELRDAFNDRVQ